MKYHEEDTTITKVVTTRVITIKIKVDITVGRIGTKTPRALTRRKMTRKNLRTRMSILC